MIEYKKGDRVMYINAKAHEMKPIDFPPFGTIGTVRELITAHILRVKWPRGSTSGNDIWNCTVDCVVPATKEKSRHGRANNQSGKENNSDISIASKAENVNPEGNNETADNDD